MIRAVITWLKEKAKQYLIEILAVGVSVAMVISWLLVLGGVAAVKRHVRNLEGTVAANSAIIAKEREATTETERILLENSELNRKQWQLLADYNKELAVPQVVGTATPSPTPTPTPEPLLERIIVPQRKTTPTVTPAPKPKVRTVYRTRYKAKPTPKPLKWPWSKTR